MSNPNAATKLGQLDSVVSSLKNYVDNSIGANVNYIVVPVSNFVAVIGSESSTLEGAIWFEDFSESDSEADSEGVS